MEDKTQMFSATPIFWFLGFTAALLPITGATVSADDSRSPHFSPSLPQIAECPAVRSLTQTDPVQPQFETYEDWVSFSSEVGAYRVELPGDLTETLKITALPDGEISWHIIEARPEVETGSDAEFYLVAYGDMPPGSGLSPKPEDIIEQVSAAIVTEANLDDQFTLEENLLFNDSLTRLLIGSLEEQILVMTVSWVSDRLYVGFASSGDRARLRHFFNSFIFGGFIQDDEPVSTPPLTFRPV